ncbi:hypothetical protein LAP8965_01931 [Lactiplantibacillus plantarum]|uniref:hypothetical protein n=1 Tax=Lactiplantibacillus plantarum TaxID=1590 RepID=UPI000CF9B31A|nr:hypothetical protein [Lactiplantibacillus plantarum]SPE07922.1 hypothetical protein LAP8963_02035 [Lactiplantibacillus plantarum]SPE11716.1 hypothetical protein LAP8964_01754 [Lactiplantibacillus plantarum]SPH06612.1 hypothetical protein LAP8965_01931 [Lactiplantibacillus plantarum]SPH09856.1 hypothetical protein LAP8966_02036 [Lactiplantibacillus plantarum]
MPEWLLRWAQSALTFVVVLTFVSVVLLNVPLKEAILVDFAYMLLTLAFDWYRSRHPCLALIIQSNSH